MTPTDNAGKSPKKRPVHWVASSKDDLKEMPEDIQDEIGKALLIAQWGGKAASAKPLHGFGGASVLEIKADDTNAQRCVYTVRFAEAVYVLHAFQKKSHQGKKTDLHDIKLIEARLRLAEDHYKANYPVQPAVSDVEKGKKP
jgi:phage-related protein